MTLEGQVESEQTTSSQIQSRLTEVIEEKETISHTNSQLLAKVKVRSAKATLLLLPTIFFPRVILYTFFLFFDHLW